MPLGIGRGGPRSDPGVEDAVLGENPHVQRPDGWARVPFVGHGPHRWRVVCGARRNWHGGALREVDTPHRT